MKTFITICIIGAAVGIGSTGFFAGAMWEGHNAEKIAIADGCGSYDSATLNFHRLKVMPGAMVEEVLAEEVEKTNAITDKASKKKGGKK